MVVSHRNEAIETYERLVIIVWVDFDFMNVARLLGVVFVHGLLVDAESDLETPSVYQSWESQLIIWLLVQGCFNNLHLMYLEHLLGRFVLGDTVGRCQDLCRANQRSTTGQIVDWIFQVVAFQFDQCHL